jgi:hypothetical protein
MGLPFIREVYLKDDYEMKQLIENWRVYQTDIRLEEAMAGLSKKEREKVKRSRESSDRIRRSMGSDGELFHGKKELDNLAAGMMEEEEIDEGNPWHKKSGSSKGGQFTSPTKGDTYSMTKKGAKATGISDKYVKKGVYSGRNKDGTAKTHGRFGASDHCGRINLRGDEIPERYRCDDYKKPYKEHQEEPEVDVEVEEAGERGDNVVSASYVKGMFRQELDKAVKEIADVVKASQSVGNKVSVGALIPVVRNLANSLKGKTPGGDTP